MQFSITKPTVRLGSGDLQFAILSRILALFGSLIMLLTAASSIMDDTVLAIGQILIGAAVFLIESDYFTLQLLNNPLLRAILYFILGLLGAFTVSVNSVGGLLVIIAAILLIVYAIQ